MIIIISRIKDSNLIPANIWALISISSEKDKFTIPIAKSYDIRDTIELTILSSLDSLLPNKKVFLP